MSAAFTEQALSYVKTLRLQDGDVVVLRTAPMPTAAAKQLSDELARVVKVKVLVLCGPDLKVDRVEAHFAARLLRRVLRLWRLDHNEQRALEQLLEVLEPEADGA